jgi:polyhydroxybutyrate depolymerase
VPPDLPKSDPSPLVFVFHGGGGNGADIAKLTKFSALADREHFLVAYPEAVGHQWNDGREVKSLSSQREKVDDVAFVSAMIHAIGRDHPVDPSRVYATGLSNGAIFCHLLASRLADRIAAIAPVSGGIAEPFAPQFKPGRPVSVFIIHGTHDPLVPFEGGEVDHGLGGRILPIAETLRRWIARDGCHSPPETGDLPDLDRNDHCTVQWSRWSHGQHGTEVLFYRIEGGGHTWPGARQYGPVFFVGWTCGDFDATATIWEFFKKHPRRADGD